MQHPVIRSAAVAALALGGALWIGGPATAAPPVAVDFTVAEVLGGGSPGTLLDDFPGCSAGTLVDTPTASAHVTGPLTTYTGTKEFDCGGGNTLRLSFKASVRGCAATDSGTWKVASGTGTFAGAKGSGRLVGTYDTGSACTASTIDDHYTGRLKLT